MFTFGREHEKACALRYVRGEKNIRLVENLMDSIHDFLEGNSSQTELLAVLEDAFVTGGSGAWEQAANWLRRLSTDFPDLNQLWLELAKHSLSKVRFRAACCLPDMSPDFAAKASALLLNDASIKVREMAAGKQVLLNLPAA
jgi:hypothetical protein